MKNAIGIWILLFVIPSSSSLGPPDSNGCSGKPRGQYCIYDLYCLNEINDDTSTYRIMKYTGENNCFHSLSYYYALYVTYKGLGDEVPKGNGPILTLMKSLDLSSNKYNVSPNLRAMNNLEYLNLSRNYLTTAKLYNVYELPNLKELDLSYNRINNIQVGQTNIFQKLCTLNLSHNYLLTITNAIFSDFPQLISLDLSHNFLNILGVSSFEGLKKMTSLYLSHNQLPEVNGTLFRFVKLQKLDLSQNKLGEIKFHDFEILQEIIDLNLCDNLIVSIESSVFSNMNSLQSLKLCKNKLQDISNISFANNSNMEHIDISQNNLKYLPLYMFKGNNIKFFDIMGNNLEGVLSKGIFEGLGRVTKLDLSKQQLTALEDSAFHGLDVINELLLHKNKLRTISNKTFINLTSLTILDLSDNQIMNLYFDTTDLVKLHLLILRNNKINQTHDVNFKGLNALHFLDLSRNKIRKLDPKMFKSLHELTNLNVSVNPLNETLETAIFNGLISLSVLDISDSQLTAVQNCSFLGMVELKILKISNNKLIEFQCYSFTGLKNVETIDLSYNNISFIQPGAFKANEYLQKLNISHNSLTTVSYGALSGLLHLYELDLSYNNIKIIDGERFYEVPSLQVLIIDNNYINSISTEEFAGSTIKELSLGGNFIPCEILVNFKKSVPYKISAVNKYDSKENVDGITCTSEVLYKTDQKQGALQNDREILSEIREKLNRLENKHVYLAQSTDSYSHILSNISREVQRLINHYDNKLSALINHSSLLINQRDNSQNQLNSTNHFLEKILISLNQKPPAKNVSNFDDLVNIEKIFRKIDDIEKIGIANSYFATSTSKAIQENMLTERSIYGGDKSVMEFISAIFTNICLGLILVILVCFILYTFYKSRKSIHRGRRSYSTRELPTSMETPGL